MSNSLQLFLLIFFFGTQGINAQSMFGDFFNSAISAFKPLAEERGSHVRESSTLVRPMLDSQRDQRVLGADPRTPLNDVPLCNGDSKLCAFVSCQADNFKNDQSFANFNLAAQVLADKKLRQQVGNNPEAITATCLDSGMDQQRCAAFTRGFLMIAKFLNSIDEPIDKMNARMPQGPQPDQFNSAMMPLDPNSAMMRQSMQSGRGQMQMQQQNFGRMSDSAPRGMPGVQRTVWRGEDSWGESVTRTSPRFTVQRITQVTPDGQQPIIPIGRDSPQMQNDGFRRTSSSSSNRGGNDDYDFSWATPPRGMSSHSSSNSGWGESNDGFSARAMGSQTWSSNGGKSEPMSPLDQPNDFLASFTPIPPTAPPLAFPTVKSVLPSMSDLLINPFQMDPNIEKMLMPIKIEPILRFRRHTDSLVQAIEHMARSSVKVDNTDDEVVDFDDEEEIESKRVKRDYYDQADAEDNGRSSASRRPSSSSSSSGFGGGSRSGGSSRGGGGGATGADDYYDQVGSSRRTSNANSNNQQHRNSRPGRPIQQRNCFELLG